MEKIREINQAGTARPEEDLKVPIKQQVEYHSLENGQMNFRAQMPVKQMKWNPEKRAPDYLYKQTR